MSASASLSGYDNTSLLTRRLADAGTDGELEGITGLAVTAVPQATIIDATVQVTPKKSTQRVAYNQMVSDFAAGRFGALICWDLDRLTRQPRQLEDWIDAAEERGLLLTTANGEADLSTDGGRLFARIKASVARTEVERKSVRQKRAAAQRAEHGRPPSGVRLTGYTLNGEVVDDEAALVRGMFARFAAGDSLRGITSWLAHQRAPTRHGQKWSPSSVRTILTNPRYAGRAIYCGRATGQPGKWEALVDDTTFDGVQAQLSDPRRITNRIGTDRRHLGSGLYRCGVCASLLRSHSGGRYRCHIGGHLTRMGASIDDFVKTVVRGRLARPDAADLLVVPNDAEAKLLAEVISTLRGRIAWIDNDYDAGLIDGRRYAVATEKVRAELTAAEAARVRAVGSTGLSSVLGTHDPAATFDNAPLGTQRAVLDALATVTLLPRPTWSQVQP